MIKNESQGLASLIASNIAESGISWSQARYELKKENPFLKSSDLPTAEQIEQALREHYTIFDPKGHEARLLELRQISLRAMERLKQFDPLLTKGVLNGCADKFSHIYLYLRSPDPKEVELFLIDDGVDLEIFPSQEQSKQAPTEEIAFEAETPTQGYFAKKGISVWIQAKIFESYPSLKRNTEFKPDPYQNALECKKFASIEDVKKLIEISSQRLNSFPN